MEDDKVSIDQYELGSLKELNLSLYYKDVIKAQASEQEPEKNKKNDEDKKRQNEVIKNEISSNVMEQEYYENEEEELEESDSVNEQVQEEKENDDGKNKIKEEGKVEEDKNNINQNKENNVNKETETFFTSYQHSLFYPILMYCIYYLNSEDGNKSERKLKIGFDDKKNIYLSVGRKIYDLFFTKKKASINNKGCFGIPTEFSNVDTSEIIKNQMKDLSMNIEELINSKKKIITTFLKGYHHKERVLKSFEGKIKGETIYMPNLIFYRKNESGKILDELDQIYLINLKKKQ